MVRYALKYILLVVLLVAARQLSARDGEPELDTLLHIGEVQVTAIKSGRALRREAASSSVLDGRTLEMGGVTAIKEAVVAAPNIFMPDYGSRITSSIYVRGLGTRIDQPVVGMNVDNVPIADKNMYDMSLPDIERIEMLRGPQATLYGRNTMGGLINIYTLSPLSYQGVRLRGEYGSRNSYRIAASAYNRFGESVGLSLAAQFAHCDGFFRNEYDGSLCDKENDGDLRLKFQYRKGGLTIENTLAGSYLQQGGYPYAYIGTTREENVTAARLGSVNYNEPCSYSRLGITEGLSITHRWERVSLSSITSYQYLDDAMHLDNDFLPERYFTLTQAKRQHDITEDIVVKSLGASRYEWLCGAFFLFKRQQMEAPVTFEQTGIERLILANVNRFYDGEYRWGDLDGTGGDDFTLGSLFTTHNIGAAAYHQSQLHLGRWHLTLGLRLDYESVQMLYNNAVHTCYSTFPNNSQYKSEAHRLDIENRGLLSKHYLELLPKFSVAIDLGSSKRNMLYFTTSKGYKAGGFNTQMFSEILQRQLQTAMGMPRDYDIEKLTSYDPEHSWNFELGGHFSLFDDRLRLDAALFHIECFDQQLTVFPSAESTGRMMTNAGRTRSSGVEFTAVARVAKLLTITASYGFTEARFREYMSGGVDYAGNYIPYAPQNTMRVQLSQRVPLNLRWLDALVLNVGCTGAGRIYWNEANDLSQPFYALLDCSVRLESSHWSLDVWAKNATDTHYDTFYFESMGNRFVQRGRPTSVGVRLGFNILERK